MLKDQIIEFSSTEKSNQLTKQTRTTYYVLVLLLLGYRNFFAKTTVPQQENKFNQISLKRFLDKSAGGLPMSRRWNFTGNRGSSLKYGDVVDPGLILALPPYPVNRIFFAGGTCGNPAMGSPHI